MMEPSEVFVNYALMAWVEAGESNFMVGYKGVKAQAAEEEGKRYSDNRQQGDGTHNAVCTQHA